LYKNAHVGLGYIGYKKNESRKISIQYNNAIQFNTVDLRALISWQDGQLNLALGTETKNKEKLKTKTEYNSEETVRAIVHEGSPGGRSETTGVGFVKEVGFKPGVKEKE